jgi:hypothetical protein
MANNSSAERGSGVGNPELSSKSRTEACCAEYGNRQANSTSLNFRISEDIVQG